MIVNNSKEEENFVDKLIKAIKGLNMKNIQSKEVLEHIIQSFPMTLKEYGINIQNLSILLNTSRYGEMIIVIETWRTINNLNSLKIGNDSRVWLKKPNAIFQPENSRNC